MKIGIVALGKFEKSEGGTTVLKGLIKYLPAIDHKGNKYFIITCKGSKIFDWLKNTQDNIHLITFKCTDCNIVQRALEMFLVPLFTRSYKIDLFVCPNNYSVMLTKKPVYLIFQRRLFYFRHLDSWYRILFKNTLLLLSLKKASKIFVASEFHKKTLLKNTNLSPQKIKVAYLGVDIPKPKKSKKFDSLVDWENNKIGLFVSVLRPYKNVEVLIKAMSILKTRYQIKNFKIAVIGDFPRGKYKNIDEYKTKIENLIKKLNTDRDIIFLGALPYEEVMYAYTKSYVFLFPTKFEGFGLPLIESMKSGLPVIASDIPVIREIAGNAALLVNPDNPHKWAQSIYRIIKNPEIRENLIQEGLERVKKYTWFNFAQKIAEEINRI